MELWQQRVHVLVRVRAISRVGGRRVGLAEHGAAEVGVEALGGAVVALVVDASALAADHAHRRRASAGQLERQALRAHAPVIGAAAVHARLARPVGREHVVDAVDEIGALYGAVALGDGAVAHHRRAALAAG
eukprot:1562387-Prymnesium_polylepis.1